MSGAGRSDRDRSATFSARGLGQSRCLTPTAHGQTAPFDLDCGPRGSVPVPPLATPTQIVLDSDATGTRCGDGSPYAFWIRLAPAGSPVEKVVVFLPGGGSCLDGPDCAATKPDLFESINDTMSQAGLMSNTKPDNPFLNWTKVFLPYCTQDLHIGGGVTDVFPEITVYRYGARNIQASLRYVRDVLWAQMDATVPGGFRPDRLQVLLSGSSAGGFGAAYNYHFLLDDLQWAHTTSVQDAGLGMDNGGPDGVFALAAVALLPTSPGWGILPYFAPYCLGPTCAETYINLDQAQSARLKAVPDQQILVVTNQVDTTQVATTNFPSVPAFVNELRASYCDIKGAPGRALVPVRLEQPDPRHDQRYVVEPGADRRHAAARLGRRRHERSRLGHRQDRDRHDRGQPAWGVAVPVRHRLAERSVPRAVSRSLVTSYPARRWRSISVSYSGK